MRLHLVGRKLLRDGIHDSIGTVEINTSRTRPVYETVLGELGIERPYTLTEKVDFASATAGSH
ncbi:MULTISPECIES: hypothetical protein [Gordonia]|uniref:hypothetical protein n=1 Tax=Gordonia TaxID=2053 RepID=UPI0032B578B4